MATNNLSDYDKDQVPSAAVMRFGIVVSEWNSKVTDALFQGSLNTLKAHGAQDKNIASVYVPGSFELIHGAKLFIENTNVDAVIILGAVIQGETRHFDYVCQGVTQGVAELNAKSNTPVIFGLLTTDNQQQAEDRAGGKHGNKGDEAAVTAIKMAALRSKFKHHR